MSLRLTSTKAKLEEMGEETEYACETLSDYRDLILGLTSNTSSPVDIMLDGEYKDVTKVYRDLAKVWKELNSMEKAGITKALAGTRQANIFTSLMENFDVVDAAIESAKNASEGIGSAMEEQNRWNESLQAGINQLNSSLQQLSTDVFSTDFLKSFVSDANSIVQLFDKIMKKVDTLKVVFGAFTAWALNAKGIIGATLTDSGVKIGLFTKQFTLFGNSINQSSQAMQLQNTRASAVVNTLQLYNNHLNESTRLNTMLATTIPTSTMQAYLASLNGAEASLQGYCTWMAQSAVVTEDSNLVIQRYISLEKLGADAQAIFRAEVAKTNPVMAQYLANTNAASMSQKNYEAALRKTELKTKALTVATQAMNIAMSMGLMAVITALAQAFDNWCNQYDRMIEKSTALREELNENVTTLESLKQQYLSLLVSTEDEKTKNEQLAEIKKALVEQYGFEEEKIRSINKLRSEGVGLIDDEITKQREQVIGETEKVYKESLGQISNGRTYFDTSELLIDVNNVRSEIKDLFKETEDGFNLSLSAENSIEFKRNLEELRTELVKVRKETGAFNEDERKLYEYTTHMLDDYMDTEDYESIVYNALTSIPLVGDLIDRAFNKILPTEKDFKEAEEELKLRTKDLYESYIKEVGKTFEEVHGTEDYIPWLKGLYQKTKDVYGDEYFSYYKTMFKDMFDDMTSNVDDFVAETDDAYTAIEALILKAKQGLSDLDSETNKAAESFDDLLKVISDNKEEDKFFSSKDMIELLDKYPDLVDAIEKTQYGYKLNEEALESLKNAKLEEKKVALQTELDKSRIVLEEAKYRLSIYQQEFDAQQALADMQAGFNQMISGDLFGGSSAIAKSNQGYIKIKQAKEDLEAAQKSVDKIQRQVDLFGTEFDDIEDSTASTKANLSNAKDELSDMKDILNDDKDYIEDLVKLTMDMLKKQKELEKEALKEKLEGYKEAVKLKKEELDTEKEIYKFQNDLKDKNKSVSDLKQKIDALSVEGVEYSLDDLKRKTELEKEYAKAKQDLEEFLLENEIDSRKETLDKEEDMYEKHIDAQTKTIEDYLDKEGVIRQDAINLINGKTQEFYNDLYNYTLTYTDKSDYEFNKLWTNAYAALEKYGNGQINVSATLAYLDAQLVDTENKIKAIETASNAASNTTKNGIDATRESLEKLNHELEGTAELYARIYSENGGQIRTVNASDFTSPLSVMNANKTYASDVYKYLNTLPKFHDGGMVDGNGEVLAKLMSGEVVSTQKQAETFLTKTLPNLIDTGTRISNNNNNTTSLSLGNIVINGNATQETVNELKSLQKEIAENIFSKINSQFRKSGIRVAY